jgi:hypothetical protein
MDNVLNAMMAYWDNTTGLIQKGWTEMWRRIGSISDEAAAKEFARIDAANAANAAQRGRERPGFAGRTGLTDEQKAAMQQESRDRQNAMFAEADRLRVEAHPRGAATSGPHGRHRTVRRTAWLSLGSRIRQAVRPRSTGSAGGMRAPASVCGT